MSDLRLLTDAIFEFYVVNETKHRGTPFTDEELKLLRVCFKSGFAEGVHYILRELKPTVDSLVECTQNAEELKQEKESGRGSEEESGEDRGNSQTTSD